MIPPGECVHGYLTGRGAFAIYDAVVVLVGAADGCSSLRAVTPRFAIGRPIRPVTLVTPTRLSVRSLPKRPVRDRIPPAEVAIPIGNRWSQQAAPGARLRPVPCLARLVEPHSAARAAAGV